MNFLVRTMRGPSLSDGLPTSKSTPIGNWIGEERGVVARFLSRQSVALAKLGPPSRTCFTDPQDVAGHIRDTMPYSILADEWPSAILPNKVSA